MRTYFKNHTGYLEIKDKYNGMLYRFEFPLKSIIKWYPANNNYQYYYSKKHKIMYLSEDTSQSDFVDYGIGTRNNFGLCQLKDWNCTPVFLDNLKLIDYFKSHYQINLLGFADYSSLNAIMQRILKLILDQSVYVVNQYDRQYDPEVLTIDYYYELAISKVTKEDQEIYYMLGKAYNLLQIYRKAMVNIGN